MSTRFQIHRQDRIHVKVRAAEVQAHLLNFIHSSFLGGTIAMLNAEIVATSFNPLCRNEEGPYKCRSCRNKAFPWGVSPQEVGNFVADSTDLHDGFE